MDAERTMYQKSISVLEKTLEINRPIYETVSHDIKGYNEEAFKKFEAYCNQLIQDIKSNKDSAMPVFSAEDELSLILNVMYYRIIRNLISIQQLLITAEPQSSNFHAHEFSCGILLRCNMLDCHIIYDLKSNGDIRKHLTSSFKFLLEYLKIQRNESEDARKTIDFFERLKSGLINRKIEPIQKPNKIQENTQGFLNNLKSLSKDLYEIYSKYDHFSLYEICPVYYDTFGRLEQIHKSLLIQVPAIHMCLIGMKVVGPNLANEYISEIYDVFEESFKEWNSEN